MSAPTIVLNLVGIMTHELYRRRYLEVLVRLCVHLGTIVHHTTCTCMHYDSNLMTKCIIACRSTSRYHARYSCIHTCKFSGTRVLSSWPVGNWRIAPARWLRAGFRKFSGGKLYIAARAGLTVYPPWIQIAHVALNELYRVMRYEFWFSMIPPSYRPGNIRSFVPLNSIVLLRKVFLECPTKFTNFLPELSVLSHRYLKQKYVISLRKRFVIFQTPTRT